MLSLGCIQIKHLLSYVVHFCHTNVHGLATPLANAHSITTVIVWDMPPMWPPFEKERLRNAVCVNLPCPLFPQNFFLDEACNYLYINMYAALGVTVWGMLPQKILEILTLEGNSKEFWQSLIITWILPPSPWVNTLRCILQYLAIHYYLLAGSQLYCMHTELLYIWCVLFGKQRFMMFPLAV